MSKYVEVIVDFVVIFLVVFLIYKILINGKRKDFEKLKKNSEVRLIVERYNLNMRKIKYKKLLNYMALIDSFIIATGSVIVVNVENMALAILIAFVIIVFLTYVLYEILGKFFNKKTKN